jgi:hypothetical protein
VLLVHIDSQLTCSVSLTTQWPPEMTSVHIALALAASVAVIVFDTWVQTSLVSASGGSPALGAIEVHVSVT